MLSYLKRLGKHAIIYSFGEFMYKGLALVFIPLYTRYLVPSEYGIIEIARAVGTILVIILPLGLDSALARYYFSFNKDKAELKQFISTVFFGILITGIIAVLFFDLFGNLIFHYCFKDIPFNPYIRLTLFTSFCFLFPSTLLILLQIQEKSTQYVIFQLFQAILMLGMILYFVVHLKAGALGQIKARFIATGSAAALSFFIFARYIKFSFIWKKYFDSLKYGLPITVHSMSWWVLILSSRFILQRYVSLSEAGIYSLGQNIGMGMEIILSSFNKAWVPLLYSTADTERPETFAKLTKYYLAIVVLIAFTLSLFSKEIIMLLTTKSYYRSHEIIPIIVLGYVFVGIYMMLTNQIFYKEKTHYILFITPVSATISIILNFLLVPKYGMYGAAFATMLSFGIFAFITYLFSNKVFPIPYEKKKIAMLIVLGIVLFFIQKYFLSNSYFIDIIIKLFSLVIFVAILWFSSYLSKEEKVKFINKISLFSKK